MAVSLPTSLGEKLPLQLAFALIRPARAFRRPPRSFLGIFDDPVWVPGHYGDYMAVPKVCGIETEYGIILRGGESNPIMASSVLVNAYVQHVGKDDIAGRPTKVSWDFEDESPGLDARGWTAAGAMPPEVETHLVNAVLTNGARYYVDHAHPEYSSPECRTPLSATLYDRAGEIVMQRSMEAAKLNLPPGQ